VTAIGRPFTDRGVARFDGAHFGKVLAEIINVHLAGQISEASDDNETAMRRKEDCVARGEGEVVRSLRLCIEDGGFSWHVPINNAELFRVG
jgi:hypothetical protein